MRNHPIIVRKYGGVRLETPAKIRAVARSLADLLSPICMARRRLGLL
jgi:putative IMPACT (imprinted ancient) family translation regulator